MNFCLHWKYEAQMPINLKSEETDRLARAHARRDRRLRRQRSAGVTGPLVLDTSALIAILLQESAAPRLLAAGTRRA